MKTHTDSLVIGVALACAITMLAVGCDMVDGTRQALAPMSAGAPPVSDAALSAQVAIALADDPGLNGYRITVVALNGDIRLNGVVSTQAQVARAGAVARSIGGVRSVDDALSVWQ